MSVGRDLQCITRPCLAAGVAEVRCERFQNIDMQLNTVLDDVIDIHTQSTRAATATANVPFIL